MMNTLTNILRNNRIYFFAYILLLISGLFLLIFLGKAAAFISLNTFHPYWLNTFFINYTFLGDGIFALCLIASSFIFLKKKPVALTLLISFLLSGLIVQIIKNIVSSPRPKLFFEPNQYLFFINGVSLSNNASFPSGHTTTAFALATVLILFLKNKKWQLPILLSAILVGYSRIYLAQHFLGDVMVGSMIGIVSALFSFYIVDHFKRDKTRLNKLSTFENGSAKINTGLNKKV